MLIVQDGVQFARRSIVNGNQNMVNEVIWRNYSPAGIAGRVIRQTRLRRAARGDYGQIHDGGARLGEVLEKPRPFQPEIASWPPRFRFARLEHLACYLPGAGLAFLVNPDPSR